MAFFLLDQEGNALMGSFEHRLTEHREWDGLY